VPRQAILPVRQARIAAAKIASSIAPVSGKAKA
jgi:hypothetical protein